MSKRVKQTKRKVRIPKRTRSKVTSASKRRHKTLRRSNDVVLMHGDVLDVLETLPIASYDLIVSSPPYNIGKTYERSARRSFKEYLEWQEKVVIALVKRIKKSGSICWQVGSHVKNGESIPLDAYFYSLFKKHGMQLRNRIVWRFNFGLNSSKRFSGRYETLLWFTKSDKYRFNLDPIRVPQLYPGKRHPKSRKNGSGRPSGNPLGKNPGDYWEFSAKHQFRDDPVWDIPNVKANHPEKTLHPCQFPIELVERCVLAFTKKGDKILDPFVGTGTSMIAAIKHKRLGVGIDKDKSYLKLAQQRVDRFRQGDWPAPGFEDTELGVLMEPEVDHGETTIYARVQA